MLILLSLKLFWREFRSGQISIMFFALVIAVTNVAGISLFTDRLEGALFNQSAEILGGDLKYESTQPLKNDFLLDLKGRGHKISETILFSSMVGAEESVQFASIKVVDDKYPLLGEVELSSSSGQLISLKGAPEPGFVWLDDRILDLLDVRIDDQIEIGRSKFIISNTIISEPDRASSFSTFAPKVIINNDDLIKTSIIQPGSIVKYTYLFLVNKNDINELRKSLEDINKPGDRISEAKKNQGAFGGALDRSNNFFLLGGLLAVIIASFTIGIGSQQFTRRHAEYVAILKVLGATGIEVKFLYALIFFWLALFSILLGLGIGWLAQNIFVDLLTAYFPTNLPLPSIKPLVVSSVTVFICLIGFAYPNLIKLVNIPPSAILHRNKSYLSYGGLNILLVLTAIFLLLFFYTERFLLSGTILFGIVVTSSLTFMIILVLFRRKEVIGLGASNAYNLAISELHKRRNTNATQVLAFTVAIGLSLIAFALKSNLVTTWESSIPEDSPNRFAVNITENDLVPIKNFMLENEIQRNSFFPITSIRLKKVHNSINEEYGVKDKNIDRTFNMTWTDDLPDNNEVLLGEWFSGSPQDGLSISYEISERYDLEVGQEVLVNLSNKKIRTYIQSVRNVNWDNFSPNFFIIGPPSLFKDTRSTYITSFYVPDSEEIIITNFIKTFNTVSLLSLDALIKQLKSIIDQVSKALEVILILTLVSAMALTLATIQDSFRMRVHQAAILRTLGAGRNLLQQATILEFAFLGLLSGILGAVLAQLGLYLLETLVFEVEPSFYPSIWIIGPLVSTFFISLVSLVLVFKMTKLSPKEILFSS